ncbi:MAG: hypothetical protein LHW45_00030 [Candidatus Cloacimonetes bacterium]|nr:hypothetical protein [Candidatus Cloacimonadota bacterium]MDY0366007.1 hypothetical protein [Candidatus Syntrophosphaera sp.]
MPEPRKQEPQGPAPEDQAGIPPDKNRQPDQDERQPSKQPVKPPRNIVPIIMGLALFLLFTPRALSAQLDIGVSLGTTYSDNVFQLSEYDLGRWDHSHPNLNYVNTTDDLSIKARFDLAYPIRYQWWKIIPSVTATISQNVSNPDKQRQDALFRLRVERYYWNFTALYGYYPENYVRSYVDTDGTQNLEKYSYARNLYRGDLNLKPFKNATIQLHGRYEQYYYNQYFTEYDANATTLGLGARYAFPAFSLGANYRYRVYDNHRHDAEDGSYASNRYSGNIRLKSTPLNNDKPDSPTFYPELTLSYEERFFQSLDPWYGGRADFIYNTSAAFNFDFGPSWNLKLDYSHAYRNVESPVEEVCRAREYSENKVSATVKYSF